MDRQVWIRSLVNHPILCWIGDAGKEYGLGIKEGEPCFGLDFEKDGGADDINREG